MASCRGPPYDPSQCRCRCLGKRLSTPVTPLSTSHANPVTAVASCGAQCRGTSMLTMTYVGIVRFGISVRISLRLHVRYIL